MILRALMFAAAVSTFGFDWDELMMLCMGAAGIAYIIGDFKRERRLDDLAVSLSERVARLEALAVDSPNQHDLAARISRVETKVEFAERLATLEAKADVEAEADGE